MIMRKMIRAITERRQLGNQQTLYLRTKNSKSALDSTNHSLESMTSRQLNTGLHSLRRKQLLTKLKLRKWLKLPLKPRLPKPKLKKKPKTPQKNQ